MRGVGSADSGVTFEVPPLDVVPCPDCGLDSPPDGPVGFVDVCLVSVAAEGVVALGEPACGPVLLVGVVFAAVAGAALSGVVAVGLFVGALPALARGSARTNEYPPIFNAHWLRPLDWLWVRVLNQPDRLSNHGIHCPGKKAQ